jgi:hypothetical protein
MLDTQTVQRCMEAEAHGAVTETLTENISLINTRLFDVAHDPAAHLGRVNQQIGMLTHADAC